MIAVEIVDGDALRGEGATCLEGRDREIAAGRCIKEEEVAVGVRRRGVGARAAEGDGDARDAVAGRIYDAPGDGVVADFDDEGISV